jgi:phosphoglycerol transferase MdoB-like AlkP superfamily enzyme
MFERSSWYRKIHFEETWFRSQLSQEGLPECPGPFPGICDAAIPGWIEGRLQHANEPQFIYWLTLNSHLPVPITNMVKDPPSCSSTAVLEDDGICAWYRLVFNVHRSVAELARKAEGRPTVFVVVGDHAPPFSSEKRRDEFSHSVVPYIVLSPKRERGQPSQQLRSIAIAQPPDHKRIQGLAHENSPAAHMHGHGV